MDIFYCDICKTIINFVSNDKNSNTLQKNNIKFNDNKNLMSDLNNNCKINHKSNLRKICKNDL